MIYIDPTTSEELLGFGVVTLLTYLLKFILKPSKFEVNVLAKLIFLLAVTAIKVARRTKVHSNVNPHLERILYEIALLKDKMKKGKIEVLG